MTLTPWDLVDLDRLAAEYASVGNRPARDAVTAMAVERQWMNTPAWIEGRSFYRDMRRKHRAAFLATQQDVAA